MCGEEELNRRGEYADENGSTLGKGVQGEKYSEDYNSLGSCAAVKGRE